MVSSTLTIDQTTQFRDTMATALAGARGRLGRFRTRCLATKTSKATFWQPLHKALYGLYLIQGGKPGDWQSFLKWIIENREEIVAFIKMIIALFSGI